MYIFPNVNELPLVGGYIVFLSIIFIIKSYKNIMSFIVALFLFWFNYSIIFANYFLDMHSFYLRDSYSAVSVIGLRVLLIFNLILCLFTKNSDSKNYEIAWKYNKPVSEIIAWGYLFLLTFILIFGFSRPAKEGGRGSPSTIYEYSIVLFIVGYYFFHSNKYYINLSSFLLILYALQNLYYGGRITALQELTIFFILFVHKKSKTNLKTMIPVVIFSFIIFTGVGLFRANFRLSTSTINDIFESSNNKALTLDTAYSAYYTSLTFIKTESILSLPERLRIFINWICSQLVGGSLIRESNVAQITRRYYIHYYGGVLPFFGHFFMGYIGTILISLVVAKYINDLKSFYKKSGLSKCILLYFVVTTPRWFLYSPSPLFRGAFLVFVVYYITEQFNAFFMKRQYMRMNERDKLQYAKA